MKKLSETFLTVLFAIAFTTFVLLTPFELYNVINKFFNTKLLLISSFVGSIIFALSLGFFKKNK